MYIINLKQIGERKLEDKKAVPLKRQWEEWLNQGRKSDLNRVIEIAGFTGTFQDIVNFRRMPVDTKNIDKYKPLTDEQRKNNKEILEKMGRELKSKGVI